MESYVSSVETMIDFDSNTALELDNTSKNITKVTKYSCMSISL